MKQVRNTTHEKTNLRPAAGRLHRLHHAGGAGFGGRLQYGGAGRRDAGRPGQHPGRRRGPDPGPAGKTPDGVLALSGKRRRQFQRLGVHRRGRQRPAGPRHPHRRPAGLDERLFRRLLPPGKPRHPGRSLRRSPQPAGLRRDHPERHFPRRPAEQGPGTGPAGRSGRRPGRHADHSRRRSAAVQRPDRLHSGGRNLRQHPGPDRHRREGGRLLGAAGRRGRPLRIRRQHPAALYPRSGLPQ